MGKAILWALTLRSTHQALSEGPDAATSQGQNSKLTEFDCRQAKQAWPDALHQRRSFYMLLENARDMQGLTHESGHESGTNRKEHYA